MMFMILCFNESGSVNTVSSKKGPLSLSNSDTPKRQFNKTGLIYWVM
jgi:hypothetical protein